MTEIQSGLARNCQLKTPPGMTVRPTSIRARTALFDSLGDLSGRSFCDLFSGSGALGLEAASRGASSVLLVETAQASLACIRENAEKVKKFCPECSISVFPGFIPECFERMCSRHPSPEIITADPPYADSAMFLDAVLRNEFFRQWAAKSVIYWELPDTNPGLKAFPEEWNLMTVRAYGPAKFLIFRKKE